MHFLQSQPDFENTHQTDYLLVLSDLSKAYLHGRKLDSAATYLTKGLQFSSKIKDSLMYNSLLLDSGTMLYFNNQYNQALDSLKKVEPYLKEASLGICYYYQGKIYEASDMEKTINYFSKVDSIYKANQIPYTELRDVYKSLSKYYEEKKQTSEQLISIKKLIAIDSILKESFLDFDKQITYDYEIPKLKQEKTRLEKLLKNNRKNNSKKIVILITLLGLSLLVVIYFIRKQSVYKNRYNKIIENQKTETYSIKKNNTDKTKHKLKISEKVIEEILYKLDNFETSNLFLQKNITLNKIAKELETNSAYLSRIVNTYKSTSFSNYVNALRIEYAIKKLQKDIQFRNYTIKAISEEIGYNNAESFSKAFYKEKGIYPSYFIKHLNKR